MPEFLHNLLLTRQFIPHGHCYLWQPGLVGLHILSDALIALAYYSIPLMLVYFVRQRKDLPFDWMFLLFGTFIVACGTTHVMEIWTLWHPTYWLSGLIKAITAFVSVSTALLLVPLIPQALTLPSPAQLEAANVALRNEIAERQQAQLALMESEERYRLLVELSPEAVFVQSDGKFTLVNKAGAKLFGTADPKELIGRSVIDFIHSDSQETVRERLYLLRAGILELPVVEEKCIRLDGRVIDVEVAAKSFNYAGKVAAQVVVRDITERKRVEQALNKALKEQEGIMNAISDVVYVLDHSGNLLKWNHRLETVTKLSPQLLQGRSALDFFPATEAATIAEAIAQVWSTGEAKVEGHLIGFDGVAIPYEWKGVLLKDTLGNTIGITGIGRDITERKRFEQALYQLNVNLEAQVNERTGQLQQSLEFEAMLKRITDKVRDSLDENQILQTVVQELVLVLGVNCCNTALYDLEHGTSTIHYEYAILNPKAQARQIQISAFPEIYKQLLQGQYCQFCSVTPNPLRGQVALLACPIINEQGVIGDLWLINHPDYVFNELEIRLVQQVANQCAFALRQARLYMAAKAQVEELEKLNALKDDFLSTVSHELRTPMSNIKMATHMLKIALNNTDERTGRYLEILQNECVRETELINDLLDLQQMEVSSVPLSLGETIYLQELLPGISAPFQLRTKQRQQVLKINLAPDLPALVSCRASLSRIFTELLNNACKYTPAGGEIVLSVEPNFSPAFTLPDTTLGYIFTISNCAEIPATELARIFEKFYRVPQADRWQQGGTGLGLALVKKLVRQMQGTISVDSSSGWTTFTVTLPHQPLPNA